MATSAVDALSRVQIFHSHDSRHHEAHAKDLKDWTFPPGSVVVRQGDQSGIGFFVIGDGEASVTIDGKEVAKLKPGDNFGAIAMLGDRVRTATVTATTELHCFVMTLWDFRSYVQGDAEVAWALLQQLASMYQRSSGATH
jgi:CRP-like cAMP-binding protein